jgi:succinoglycan biosynthesis transport protein ExoP
MLVDSEMDLRECVNILRRKWRIVITVAIIAFVAAGLFSFLLPPVYEAKAVILVARPPLQTGAPPDPMNPGLKIATVLSADLSAGTLAAFATLPAVTRRVARVAGEGTSAKPELSEKLVVRPVPNTNLLELSVRGRDAVRVARVANVWASVVATEGWGLFSAEAEQSYRFFDSQVSGAGKRLLAAEEAVRNFNGTSRIGLLQARVGAVTGQIAGYLTRLTDLSVELQKSETELAEIPSQIRHYPEKLVLSRSITTDPFVLQAASQAEKRDFVELSRLSMRNEELNPLYTNLEQARANASIRVGVLKAEYARVSQAVERLNHELSGLQDELAAQQLRSAELAQAVNDAKQVYDVLVQRRDEARVASASQAGAAKVVSEAVVPDRPVGPHKALNMILGALLGLMGGTVVALMVEHFTAPSPALRPSSAHV